MPVVRDKNQAQRIADSDVDTDSLSVFLRFAYIPVTNRPSDSTRNILGIYFVFSIFPSSEDDSKMSQQVPESYLKNENPPRSTYNILADLLPPVGIPSHPKGIMEPNMFKNVFRENASPRQDVSHGRSIPVKNHHRRADKESESAAKIVKTYREVMEKELHRVMTSIDKVDSVVLDMVGPERTPIFFALLYSMLFEFDPKADIPKFMPEMSDFAIKLQVPSFLEYVLSIMNGVKTLLLSSPDSTRLQQMPEHEFVSLLQTVIASTFKQTKSKRSRFTMVNQEIFKRALGHGDLESKPYHCIYFPPDCRLFVYIPTVKGSYWSQKDIQRTSKRARI